MISPDVAPTAPNEILENTSNGNGYWAFTPEHPTSFADQAESMGQYGDFLEVKDVLETAFDSGSVLVHGAPGAGKSHLVRELQTTAVIHDVPTFCLTTHINGGKATGIDNIREPFAAFSDSVGEHGEGLVILDNIDYLGYRGSSRTRGASARYAAAAEGFVDELKQDGRFAIVGTAHNDEWRQARWGWQDPAIDDKARAVLEKFDAHMVFEGKMSLVGLAHVMHAKAVERGDVKPDLGKAARVIRGLNQMGQANFFHANHLNPDKFLENPEAALEQIHAGRRERIGRS